MFRIGDVIGSTYRLMEEIGRGGCGIIYKAYHIRLQKYVVIKKMQSNFSGAIKDRAEVDLLKKLHHSYLPQVYDFLQLGREVFTVMEYVDGCSLEEYLEKKYVFNEKDLIRWLKELLEVLSYLHSQDPAIYHNDVKPGNIMINRAGHAYLIDFNISLDATESNKIIGLSERYASPEQKEKAKLAKSHQYHENIKIDARSDLYGLGITFNILMQKKQYSEGFCKILQKATYENKNERFKNADQMLKALENLSHYDSQYQRYRYITIMGRSIYALIIILSFLFAYWAYHTKVKEDYARAFQELSQSKVESEYDEIIVDGVAILNKFDYGAVFKRAPEEKSRTLNEVGNAYYAKENYTEATKYYEEALKNQEVGKEKAVYLRNCAVTYAKSNRISDAEEMLKQAKEAIADNAEIEIIKGEIAYTNNDKKTALQAFVKAKEEANETETRVEALRRAGKLHVEYKSYQNAASCYEQINKTEYMTFEDQMNLAVSYELQKKYDLAENIFNKLQKKHPEDYRVYLCLTRIALNNNKKDQVQTYYQKAKTYYKEQKIKTKDKNMEALIQEMEDE